MIDAARMRRNLDLTGGLIVAEAVMMGLAPHIGRGEAHHVVKHACDAALAEGIPLADALAREPAVASRLDRAAIERLTDPAHYLGSADAFIDRVLHARHGHCADRVEPSQRGPVVGRGPNRWGNLPSKA